MVNSPLIRPYFLGGGGGIGGVPLDSHDKIIFFSVQDPKKIMADFRSCRVVGGRKCLHEFFEKR